MLVVFWLFGAAHRLKQVKSKKRQNGIESLLDPVLDTMNILFCGKWPPIQGGVCRESYEFVVSALSHGATVTVVTDALLVEQNFKMALFHPEDAPKVALTAFGNQFKLINIQAIPAATHIPAGKMHLSQCIGALEQQIRASRPDAIVGSYFEPYGLAAMLVGRLHKLPTFIRHAGSDLGRLASFPELHQAYSLGFAAKEIKVLAYDKVRTNELLAKLGLAREQIIYMDEGSFDLPEYHLSSELDVPLLLAAANEWLGDLPLEPGLIEKMRAIGKKPFMRRGPVIGIFGKAGHQKGTFDLANALATLASNGKEFTFIPMCSGQPRALTELYSIIAGSEPLARNTFIMPPIALWHIRSYIQACDVVAFLENRFSVDFHTPGVPWQVIGEGKPLIISADQYERIGTAAQLVAGRNCIVAEDPREPGKLEEALDQLFDAGRAAALTYGASNLKKILMSRGQMHKVKPKHPMYAAITSALGQ